MQRSALWNCIVVIVDQVNIELFCRNWINTGGDLCLFIFVIVKYTCINFYDAIFSPARCPQWPCCADSMGTCPPSP